MRPHAVPLTHHNPDHQPALIIATFTYHHETVTILAVGPSLTPALRCPGCLTIRSLRRHHITLGPAGKPSINPPIFCPDPSCHWHATVTDGKGKDVGEAVASASSAQSAGLARSPRLPGAGSSSKIPALAWNLKLRRLK